MQADAGSSLSHPTYARVSCQAMQLLLVLVRQLVGRELVLPLADVVGLYHRREHREAVLDIERGIIAVGVDACA